MSLALADDERRHRAQRIVEQIRQKRVDAGQTQVLAAAGVQQEARKFGTFFVAIVRGICINKENTGLSRYGQHLTSVRFKLCRQLRTAPTVILVEES